MPPTLLLTESWQQQFHKREPKQCKLQGQQSVFPLLHKASRSYFTIPMAGKLSRKSYTPAEKCTPHAGIECLPFRKQSQPPLGRTQKQLET